MRTPGRSRRNASNGSERPASYSATTSKACSRSVGCRAARRAQRRQQSGQDLQQGRLAAAVGADDADAVAAQHGEVEVAEEASFDAESLVAPMDMGSVPAGVGYAGSIAQMVAMAGIFAYSRDMEREADDIGFEFMADAGYDFHEAANIWQALIEERDAADQPDQFILFASHPTTGERVNTLREMAVQLESQGRYGQTYQREYLDATRPFRAGWLKNELRKRDFAASQVVLKHLFVTGDNPGELYYYQGELYRMRAQEGDLEKAIASYQKALSYEEYPPAVLRSLGLLFWKTRKFEDAKDSFNHYLVVDPDATDYEMIKSYLEELK